MTCIIWPGALNSGGYPVTWHKGKIAYMHRVIAGAKKGEVVMHTCDTPSCVNPTHLVVGTSAENSADMVKKKRQATGEECGNSKLRAPDVEHIRELQGSLSSRKVGKLFGISKTNVLDIWNNKIWRNIE